MEKTTKVKKKNCAIFCVNSFAYSIFLNIDLKECVTDQRVGELHIHESDVPIDGQVVDVLRLHTEVVVGEVSLVGVDLGRSRTCIVYCA